MRKRDYFFVAFFMFWVTFLYHAGFQGYLFTLPTVRQEYLIREILQTGFRRMLTKNEYIHTKLEACKNLDDFKSLLQICERKEQEALSYDYPQEEINKYLGRTNWDKKRNEMYRKELDFSEKYGWIVFVLAITINLVIAILFIVFLFKIIHSIRQADFNECDNILLRLFFIVVWWYMICAIPSEEIWRDSILSLIKDENFLDEVDFQRMFFELAILFAVFGTIFIWRKLGRRR